MKDWADKLWMWEPPLRERPWHTRVMFWVWRLCRFTEAM